jgi:hypothetical protein
MSRNSKIILGVLGGVVVLCMCVCVGGWIALRFSGDLIGKAVAVEDPIQAARIARDMIDYELPPGYQEEAALNFIVMNMVIISGSGTQTGGSANPLIILVGTSADLGMSETEIRNQIQEQVLQSMQTQGFPLELVEQRAALLRGQDEILYIYEGVDDKGNKIREVMSSLFEGKQGMVMVMIAGPARTWDQGEVDHFLNSIY